MKTSKVTLNHIEERQKLLSITTTAKNTRRVKNRAMALNMHLCGHSNVDIARTLCISEKSVSNYISIYLNKGFIGLLQENPYRPKSELEDYSEEIIKSLEDKPCSTINECCSRIEKLTGIKRRPTQIAHFIKKKKFKLLKTGQIPAKANPVAQKEFLEKELTPKLEEAKKNERKLLFVDAAHFVMGAFLAYLWCRSRIFIKTSSGRQRYNVLGAIDVFNQDLITVTNKTYINSDTLCELLLKIFNQYSHLAIPITIVLDNAKYQRCAKVVDYAKKLNIELLFLPTYSPNLNLIERLWKFVKKKCLRGQYYEKLRWFILR